MVSSQVPVSLFSADLVSLLGLCEDVVLVLVSLLELGEDVVLVLVSLPVSLLKLGEDVVWVLVSLPVSLLKLGEEVVWVLVSLLGLDEVEKDLVELASTYCHPAVKEV
jgi:hypothetical protein